MQDTVAQFAQALKDTFMVEVRIEQQSPALFMVLPLGHAIGFAFYRTLAFSTVHQEISDGTLRFVHIDEDLWVHKQEVIISRIGVLMGKAKRIYARDTELRRVTKQGSMAFQEKYHLQVALPGKYRYGLFYGEEMVSLAVFSGGRKMRGQAADYRSFELLRLCHRGNYLIVGGLSKLIKGLVRDFHPGDIMTYVDRDWSNGENYKPLGFQPVEKLDPQEFFITPENGHRYYYAPIGHYHTLKNLGSVKMRRYTA